MSTTAIGGPWSRRPWASVEARLIDQFGVPYYLKIDIEFVRDLVTSSANQHVVKAIVNLAKGFGCQTVAEGVEDGDTLSLLRDFGVDFAQGYYLGRPVPAWQFGMLLDSGAEGILLPDVNVASDDRASLG